MLILLAVVDGQRDLAVLGHHAQQGGDPHPEDGAGAADGDSARHTGNITGTDRCRQCGADRLERGHGAVAGLGGAVEYLTDGIFPYGAEFGELQKAGADAEVQPHPEDEHRSGQAPYDAV